MKANRLIWTLALLLMGAIVAPLPAQQTEADHRHFEEIKTKAEKGEATAQYEFGRLHDPWGGTTNNPIEAVKWYRKAPDSDSSKSGTELSDSNPLATGTGFFITEDGFLITNAHVVEDAAQVRLVTSAGFLAAKVVKVDAANDLALLKAEGKFSSLP